jgi:pyruvate ferredoxin oxidoreductase delta subunit
MKKKKQAQKIIFKSEKEFPLMPMSMGSFRVNKTGVWRNIKPIIDNENCIQCGICWKFCPDVAIFIEDEWPVIDYEFWPCSGARR